MITPSAGASASAWRLDSDRLVTFALAAAVAVPLFLFVLVPLADILMLSFATPDGFGLGNYVRYFQTPKFSRVIANSLVVSACATVITVVLAYGFAYAMHRTAMRWKTVFGLIALLPLFAPSLVQALGILFLLGRNGLINRAFDLGIDVYGFWGIVIADVLYSFPHAYLILSAALAVADARIYESAQMLGAGPLRVFRTVTLPATKYGLMSACFVVFTIVITDFGNPMVIGADYNVLATEIYNQVSGQANFEMGAVIGVVLLIPAALAVVVEKLVSRRSFAVIGDRSQPLTVRPHRVADRVAFAYSLVVCGAILSIIGIVFLASFVTLWPYNLHLSLRHYRFEVQNGIEPLWTSIHVSLMAAGIGMAVTVAAACVLRRLGPWAAQALYFLSILPAAVPGMVLGLGYILAFNDPAHPLHFLYGTLLILAICNVYHYHAQGFLVATTSVNQISRVFDEASAVLGGGLLRTLARVTLPIIWPTVASVVVFFFVRSMVTLSAVIFLITPETQLAAVSVLLLDDSGNQNQAAAFSVCIMAVVGAALLAFHFALRWLVGRDVALVR
ncbi:MAG: ABC transporter permease subunit [Alphaproteobacteria bacterium]|nr:ABC transporter permease subunit [Alphaproteobacteria bacterium]